MIHLIPAAIVLAAVAMSWRWGWVGALVFLSLGAFYIATAWGRVHWSAHLLIAGPMFLLGVLFALDRCYVLLRTRSEAGN